MTKPKHAYRLTINQCEHGTRMVSLDTEHGGTRICGPRCCGRWKVVESWPLTDDSMRLAVAELQWMIESAKYAVKGQT